MNMSQDLGVILWSLDSEEGIGRLIGKGLIDENLMAAGRTGDIRILRIIEDISRTTTTKLWCHRGDLMGEELSDSRSQRESHLLSLDDNLIAALRYRSILLKIRERTLHEGDLFFKIIRFSLGGGKHLVE